MKKAKSISKWMRYFVAVAGTVAVLAFIFSKVNWLEFVQAVQKINIWVLVAAFIVLFLSLIAQSVKWWGIIDHVEFRSVFKASMATYVFYLLPAGAFAADSMRIYLLKDQASSYLIGNSVLVDEVTKMLCVMITLAVGMLFSKTKMIAWQYMLVILGLILCTALIILLIKGTAATYMTKKLLKLRQWNWVIKLQTQLEKIAEASHELKMSVSGLLFHLFFGVLGEVLYAVGYVVLAAQFGIKISMFDWLWINAFARMLSGLPVSIAGLGLREGVLVSALALYGVATETAMTLSLLYTTLNLITLLISALYLIGRNKNRPAQIVA